MVSRLLRKTRPVRGLSNWPFPNHERRIQVLNVDAPDFPIASASGSPSLGPFQFVSLTLSLVVIGRLSAESFFRLPPELVSGLAEVDPLICGVFPIGFAVRSRAAASRSAVMKWGLTDPPANIPVFDLERWGRFVSVRRITRLFRGVRSIRRPGEMLFENKNRHGVAAEENEILVEIRALPAERAAFRSAATPPSGP